MNAGSGPAAAATNPTFNPSEMELIAIQLASIRANHSDQSMLERCAYRFMHEFYRQGWKSKARFMASLGHATGSRLARAVGRRLARKAPSRPAGFLDSARASVVAVCAGGMGDLILYGALFDHLYREWGCPLIHVVVNSKRMAEASFVYHGSPSVALLTDHADVDPKTTPYDVVIKLCQCFSYEFVREDRLRAIAPQMYDQVTAGLRRQKPYRPVIEAQPWFDGAFAGVAARSGMRRLDLLGWMAQSTFNQNSQLRLAPKPEAYRRFSDDSRLSDQPYITIHNGYDNVAHRNTEKAVKPWPELHFTRFVDLFKRRFPNISVVQLGAKTSRPIPNVDLCLLNDTTIHEAAWILKHALLHVDGDSGMVHMARALHTRSLVMYGPTNDQFFRYDQNLSLSSTNCRNCWWTRGDWMQRCVRGLDEAECMTSILPETVLAHAEQHLTSLSVEELELIRSDEMPSEHPFRGAACLPTTASAFEHWRRAWTAEALAACNLSQDPRIESAWIEDSDVAPQPLPGFVSPSKVFRFADVGKRHGPSVVEVAHRPDGEITEFGSIYNLPAESDDFDVVVMQPLTARTPFPEFVLTEALRIVRDGGYLVLTYENVKPGVSFGDGAESTVNRLFGALRNRGVTWNRLPAASGGIVFRKSRRSARFV